MISGLSLQIGGRAFSARLTMRSAARLFWPMNAAGGESAVSALKQRLVDLAHAVHERRQPV